MPFRYTHHAYKHTLSTWPSSSTHSLTRTCLGPKTNEWYITCVSLFGDLCIWCVFFIWRCQLLSRKLLTGESKLDRAPAFLLSYAIEHWQFTCGGVARAVLDFGRKQVSPHAIHQESTRKHACATGIFG